MMLSVRKYLLPLAALLLCFQFFILPESKISAQDNDVILGTGNICDPVPGNRETPGEGDYCKTVAGVIPGAWSGCYVYYGTYENSPVKYRVLSKNETAFGGNTMLLDSDRVLAKIPFDCNPYSPIVCDNALFDGNTDKEWAKSYIKAWLNSDDHFLKGFTNAEKDAVSSSTKSSPSKGDGNEILHYEWVPLTGEKIFLLDVTEILNRTYGFMEADERNCAKIKYIVGSSYSENFPPYWWLRSFYDMISLRSVVVLTPGYVEQDLPDTENGAAPAFNVKLSSVIFSSPISGTENEFKLSLLDKDLTASLQSGKTFTVEGSTITIPYSISGKNAGNASRLIVLAVDSAFDSETAGWGSGTKIKQSLIKTDPGTSGTISFKLDNSLDPAKLGTDFHVYLIAEDLNDGMASNYASQPFEIKPEEEEESPYVLVPDEDDPDGNGETYVTGSGEPRVIEIERKEKDGSDSAFERFEKALESAEGGILLRFGDEVYYPVLHEDYEYSKGSLIITLFPEYLDTLPAGEYVMEVFFAEDNGEITSFEVPLTITEPEEEICCCFRCFGAHLPSTGLTSRVLREQPKDLSYKPLSMMLQIPALNVRTVLVNVPMTDNTWQVDWLGDRAGLLEGSALPGEGLSLVAAHNTLNAEAYGPFALLSTLETNDVITVTAQDGSLKLFRVYANELLDLDDMQKMTDIAGQVKNSLVLITCENEAADGGYLNRRAVFAEPVM